MSYTQAVLEAKIMAMYPEIKEHGIGFSMDFDDEEGAWIINFKKAAHELTTHLKKEDADECINGVFCVHLGVQMGEFVDNFEREEV